MLNDFSLDLSPRTTPERAQRAVSMRQLAAHFDRVAVRVSPALYQNILITDGLAWEAGDVRRVGDVRRFLEGRGDVA